MYPRNQKPNILILVLDALRARNVSCYGYRGKTTPYLDSFACENPSVRFQYAFSSSTWTIPSHTSMLSGLYVSQHKMEAVNANRRLNQAIVTLPQVLNEHGYRTAAFSQNMLFSPKYHFSDFGEFYEMPSDEPAKSLLARLLRRANGSTKNAAAKMARYLHKMAAPRTMLDSLYAWITRPEAQEPFFAMTNIAGVHYAWAPPLDILLRRRLNPMRLLNDDFIRLKPYEFNSGRRPVTDELRAVWQAHYDAAIAHVDREVGRFLKRLRTWSGWSNTIVVITSDHGEMLGDYRDIVGHMLCLHDNLLRVPLIVRHPDFPVGHVSKRVVQLLDLFPSVLEWAQVPADKVHPAQLQRPSLSSELYAAPSPTHFVYAEEDYTDSYKVIDGLLRANPALDRTKFARHQIAVRSATHKYIWCVDRPDEFYDLRSDPDERCNLLEDGRARDESLLAAMRSATEIYRSELERFPPVACPAHSMTSEITERLKALGYVS